MHQPEIYEKVNRPAREGTTMAIKKYGHLIKWSEDRQDTMLDIGCGPGNVLLDIVMPVFEGKYSKVYGTDLSEKMINFANQRYSDREDVIFDVQDVMKENNFVEKYGQVDHAVSFYMIHWLQDPGKGFRNIFEMLKPGGDFFSVHIHSSAMYDILMHMDQNEKWNHYFDNVTQFVPYSQTSTQPEQDLRDYLSNNGFTDIFIDVHWQDSHLESYAATLSLFTGIIAQVDRVPEERRAEYVKEFVDYGITQGLLKVLPSGEVSFPLKLFIMYVRKPIAG